MPGGAALCLIGCIVALGLSAVAGDKRTRIPGAYRLPVTVAFKGHESKGALVKLPLDFGKILDEHKIKDDVVASSVRVYEVLEDPQKLRWRIGGLGVLTAVPPDVKRIDREVMCEFQRDSEYAAKGTLVWRIDGITRPVARIRPSWRQPAANFLEHFLDGLRVLQRPRDLLITTVASLVMWYVIFWQIQMTLFAFDVHLPLRASFLIVTLTVIGLAVPTPGGVGGFHKASQVGLTLFFGIELNRATAIAIAYHAVCFVPITIIGLLCLPLLGLKPREVGALSNEEAEL